MENTTVVSEHSSNKLFDMQREIIEKDRRIRALEMELSLQHKLYELLKENAMFFLSIK